MDGRDERFGKDENMSTLTFASSEISASSGARNDTGTGTLYPQHSSTSIQEPQPKKKRNHPGHPDPEAEVIALSPKTLLATNRFVCDVCNKGFQRDQNLQLHRRGHNLPWKLKQRSSKEDIRKKVYVCPEPTCVHHDPSRALGDLTGIKKHFCRKHGEKKWKCEKCSKLYAVQSDWKAHSKICGTRDYKCDCGTIFSRRDSFITHRAFCDALAQESTKAITTVNLLMSSDIQLHSRGLQAPSVKKEQENNLRPEIPSWLAYPSVEEAGHGRALRALDFSSSPLLSTTHLDHTSVYHENPNPTILLPSLHQSIASHHMSATALLQKASQIGVTMSQTAPFVAVLRPHQQVHVPESTTGYRFFSMASSLAVSGLDMPSREEIGTGPFGQHGLASYGNKAGITSEYLEEGATNTGVEAAPSLIHDMMDSTVTSISSFEEALRVMMNPTRDNNFEELVTKSSES